jgi:hypothetical protein
MNGQPSKEHKPSEELIPKHGGCTVGHGPQMAPGEPTAERDGFGEVVLAGRLREALRRMVLAIPSSRTLATLRDTLLPKLLSRPSQRGQVT